MVIQIKLYVKGQDVEIKTYRDVAQHNYTAYVSGFYANKGNYNYGEMLQIRGNDKKIVHKFGALFTKEEV